MAFQSKFADNDKLKKCAANDIDHLGQRVTAPPNLVGEHIALIHEALNTWALKQTPRVGIVSVQEVRDKRYGDSTAKLVALYKSMQTPPILNYKGEIDDIVGRKTVVALDLELPPKGDTPPSPAPSRTRIDVVVKFQGALSEFDKALSDDSVFPDSRLKDYLAKSDRVLLRMGQTTHTIREEADALLNGFVLRIETALKIADSEGFARGKVCLWGTSSGARNVIALGSKLTLKGIVPTYIAALDAAFFPNESSTQPGNHPGEPFDTEIPQFRMPNPRAKTQKSFFQRVGNHKKDSRPQFTSRMGGEEVHGNVDGFTPRDLTTSVKAKDPASDDDAHIALTSVAKDEVLKDILAILNGD